MDNFPMRINKYLAWKQIATRKGADKLIQDKKVYINGKLAALGSKVLERDIVEVKGEKNFSKNKYYAFYKPVGVETPDIAIQGMFPVGRLDKNSHGLILLTNDGRITDKLLNPKYFHEKEYLVKTKEKLRSNFKQKMEAGVQIEGYKTRPCKVQIINENTFKIILTEGKKHQIRRMCVALFQEVADLKRIRVENIQLKSLRPGQMREIKGKELDLFLNLNFGKEITSNN